MKPKNGLTVARHVAVALLSALPIIAVGAATPAATDVRLLPLPSSLAAAADLGPTLGITDPRAEAVAQRLEAMVREQKAVQMNAVAPMGVPRARMQGAAPEAGGRKLLTVQHMGQGFRPLIAAGAGDSAPRFKVKMRAGTVRSLRGANGNTILQPRLTGDEQTARAFLREQRGLLGLADPDRELSLRSRESDSLGHRHLRFRQSYAGLPVFGAELIAQVDASGNLISVGGVYATTPKKLVTQPVVTREAAAKITAALHPNARSSTSELVVYLTNGGTTPHLAWKSELNVSALERLTVVVDAHRGTLLADYTQVPTVNVAGRGTDLLGHTQQLNVWQDSGRFTLTDTTKKMFDPSSHPPQLNTGAGMISVTDANHQPANSDPHDVPPLNLVTSTGDANGTWLPDGVSAAVNLSATYDYYLARHNRNSMDGAGGNLVAVVRYGLGWPNAHFDPGNNMMFFGDGGARKWASALDVVGHELTHGVVAHSANLEYRNQSGALNEAFADIFGEMIEARATGKNDWLIGTQIGAFRNLANPGAMACGNDPCPSKMSEYIKRQENQDFGGVHSNSQIVGHAYYLLAAGLDGAIGISDAERIFYRALTTKLSPLSEFVDAREAAIQSAEELFSADSGQAKKVAEAFDAVEIYDTVSNPEPQPYPGGNGADSAVLVFWNSTAHAYYLGRFEAALNDPAQGVQLSTNPVANQRPAVTGDGAIAAFVDASHDFCLIATNAAAPESCLGMPNTVSSVAMAPDGQTFAFVFRDSNGHPDNRISVINTATKESKTFELVVPTHDGDSNINVLQADSMDFTANSRLLVYDAFNALTLDDGSKLGAWSIYALDLLTNTTLTVLPPTQGLDIAFPAIGQRSDTRITYDVFDSAKGQNSVVAGNLLTGARAIVATTPNYSSPSFTSKDDGIVYSVADSASPTQYSLARQALSADGITPTGNPTYWVRDADFGVVYQRGAFTGPSNVDLKVSQSVSARAPHRAVFAIQLENKGTSAASAVKITDTVPQGAGVVGATVAGGTCSSTSGGQIECTLDNMAAGAAATLQVELEAKGAGDLKNAVTAFANETDADASTNTAFATATAASLNTAPAVGTAPTAQTTVEGSTFSLNVAGSFTDADRDALTFSASGLPSGLSMNATSGAISGTVATGAVRSTPYAVEVTAKDAFGGAATSTFNLTVNSASASSGGGSSGGNSSAGGGSGGGGSFDVITLLVGLGSSLLALVRRLCGQRGGG